MWHLAKWMGPDFERHIISLAAKNSFHDFWSHYALQNLAVLVHHNDSHTTDVDGVIKLLSMNRQKERRDEKHLCAMNELRGYGCHNEQAQSEFTCIENFILGLDVTGRKYIGSNAAHVAGYRRGVPNFLSPKEFCSCLEIYIDQATHYQTNNQKKDVHTLI